MNIEYFASSTPQIIDALKYAIGSVGVGADAVVTTAVRGQFIEGVAIMLIISVVVLLLACAWFVYTKIIRVGSDDDGIGATMVLLSVYTIALPFLAYYFFQGIVHVFAPDWALMQEVLDAAKYAR